MNWSDPPQSRAQIDLHLSSKWAFMAVGKAILNDHAGQAVVEFKGTRPPSHSIIGWTWKDSTYITPF